MSGESGFADSVGSWIIHASGDGQIEWSGDNGATWTIALGGCLACSMPILLCLHFDTISALVGRYSGNCGIIASLDSGRTWQPTNFPAPADGVRSFARLGDIVYAATTEGIFASRDNFSTWWSIVESASVKYREARSGIGKPGMAGHVSVFSLSGRRLGPAGIRLPHGIVLWAVCSTGMPRPAKLWLNH
jgi:hypothetical protein